MMNEDETPAAATSDGGQREGGAAARPANQRGQLTGDVVDFAAQFRAHCKPVFREAAERDQVAGRDLAARAREYAERGKPDFVLAYLLAATLPDADKRATLAAAYERRAQITEQRADEFDRRFHRPFPLLRLEAAKDRTLAQRIRAGGSLRPGLGRPLPTL